MQRHGILGRWKDVHGQNDNNKEGSKLWLSLKTLVQSASFVQMIPASSNAEASSGHGGTTKKTLNSTQYYSIVLRILFSADVPSLRDFGLVFVPAHRSRG